MGLHNCSCLQRQMCIRDRGYITAVSIGTPQVKSEEASIHELGVSLMQYWIALLAIAVVFVMVLLAYVVIRGGSSHYRG